MKTIKSCLLILIVLGSSFVTSALGQDSDDMLLYQASVRDALGRGVAYQKSINIGFEYTDPPYQIDNGHAFYYTALPQNGSVLYNNILYTDLVLQYDLVLDELLTVNTSGQRIILVKDRVKEFSLDGQQFKNITEFGNNTKMKGGYYHTLFEAPEISLYAKRKKLIKGLTSQIRYHKTDPIVVEKDLYFLSVGEQYYPVKKAKEIVKILKTNGKDAKKIPRRKMSSQRYMVYTLKHNLSLTK